MRKIFLNENPDKIDQVIELIRQTPYFKTVDPSLLKEILLRAWIFELGSAEYLIRESNKSDSMVYILLQGEFDVIADRKFILKIDQPGSTIGEMAVISPNTRRSADVIAVSYSKVIAIESNFLNKTDLENQKLTNVFLKMFSNILAEKLRVTTDRAKLYENAVLEKNEISKFNKEITEVSQDLENELQKKLAQIKLFSQVVESNLDAIIIADDKGRLQSVNQAFLKLFLYEAEEIEKLNLKVLFKQLIEEKSNLLKMFSGGWKGEKTGLRKDKTNFPVLISISPIKTEVKKKKTKTVFAVVVRDITLQKEYEQNILKANKNLQQTYQELENTLQELEKSNKVKNQFLSSISSQIKTPLDYIINKTEINKKKVELKADTSSIDDFFVDVLREGKKMGKLIGNLLSMAELTSEINLAFKVLRFNRFINRFQEQNKKAYNLSFDIDPEISAIIADEKKLQNAIIDILDYLSAKSDGKDLHIKCWKDTEKDLLRIDIIQGDLEVFYLPDDFVEKAPLSDGIELSLQKGELSLPLAKRIVELHNGELTIINRKNSELVSLRLPMDPDSDRIERVKVLLVDENEWDRRLLAGIIEKEFPSCDIYEFETQVLALNAINAIKPTVIIVDPFFSDEKWDYKEFLVKLISGSADKLSTLVVSDHLSNMEMRNQMFLIGITDFLFKPFTVEDALFKIKTIIENKQRLSLLTENVQKAKMSAATDGMTKLYNRKHFDNFVKEQFIKAELQQSHCSLIMIDVDNFKHYNDTNGHQLGDEVLIKVAKIMKDGVRKSDMAARYGGEEFIIVLPGTAKKMAEKIADKLRTTIEKTVFPNEEKQPNGMLTASFGVSSFPENGDTPEVVLKGADHCLYLAKERGRNNVVGAEGIIEL